MATNKLSVIRGNTLVINYTNEDTSANPISLNGATLYFTVKGPPGYDSIANDSSAIWQITSTGNVGNTCTFTCTPADTWQPPLTYDWDITIEYSSANVITPMQGTIVIVPTPTNKPN